METDIPNEGYPLQWPASLPRTAPDDRKTARFGKREPGASWSQLKQVTVANAIGRLMAEIRAMTRPGQSWRIQPDLVVISSDLQLRRDGMPYSGKPMPRDPGVAVYFTLDDVPHCMPCDRWNRLPDNLAAIAAHMGALRGMERWGVGDLRQIFSGFAQLPPPGAAGQPHWSEILGVAPLARMLEITAAWKRLRSQCHPDRGGDADQFHLVNLAYEQAQREVGP